MGENLYWYWSSVPFEVTAQTAEEAVEAWYSEIRDFQYSRRGVVCPRRNEKGVIGHFTQVMWADSTAVGCAYATCGDGTSVVVVCNYGPAGNFNQRQNPPFGKAAAQRLDEHPINEEFGGLPSCD